MSVRNSIERTSTADRYERVECIGRGSFGDVYRGIDKETGREVAIKVIDLEDVEDDIDDIHREISILANCRSKNITHYYGCALQSGTTELCIIMELMAGSVADLLESGPLNENCIAYILHETLCALDYLHNEHRIHRDIKAANILMSTGGSIKLTDFGVSGQLTSTLGYRRRTFVGTPYWMAPEVIESSDEGYSEAADIWSVGITAIEMAKGRPPHADTHPMRVLFLIPKEPPPSLEGAFSQSLREFVSLCLQKDPAARPSVKDLLIHSFLRSAKCPDVFLERIKDFASRPRGLTDGQYRTTGQFSTQQTLPKWSFPGGTMKQNTVKAPVRRKSTGTGTVKAFPLDTITDATFMNDTLTNGTMHAQARTGTLPSNLSTASLTDIATKPFQKGGPTDRTSISNFRHLSEDWQDNGPGGPLGKGLVDNLMRPALLNSLGEQASSTANLALEALTRVEEEAPGSIQDMLTNMLSTLNVESEGMPRASQTPSPKQGTTTEESGPLATFLLARWRQNVLKSKLEDAFFEPR